MCIIFFNCFRRNANHNCQLHEFLHQFRSYVQKTNMLFTTFNNNSFCDNYFPCNRLRLRLVTILEDDLSNNFLHLTKFCFERDSLTRFYGPISPWKDEKNWNCHRTSLTGQEWADWWQKTGCKKSHETVPFKTNIHIFGWKV